MKKTTSTNNISNPQRAWRGLAQRLSKVVPAALGLLFVLIAAAPAAAQTVCSGTLSGTYDNIVVNGGSCTLSGATVLGSVTINSGGNLTATGGTDVLGGVAASFGGNLNLQSVTILGDVALADSGNVTVGAAATIGPLKLERSGAAVITGAVANLDCKQSLAVTLNKGSHLFLGGLSVFEGTGTIQICGSTIEGEVKVIETVGAMLAGGTASCGGSLIHASVLVEKGTGNVRVSDATLTAGDLFVIEQAGSALVERTSLSDVAIEAITGPVTLQSVTTDSDTKIIGNDGAVSIKGSLFGSDIEIKTNGGAVTVAGNSFSDEVVVVESNGGAVAFTDNIDLSFSIVANHGVTIGGNNFINGSVGSNTGGVSIVNNTGETLLCSGNNPAPTGSGNTITVLADGQCAGF